MADRPVVAGLARIAVSGTFESEPWVNVFHLIDNTNIDPLTFSDLQALHAALLTSGAGGAGLTFFSGMYGLLDNNLLATQVKYESYNGPSSAQYIVSIAQAGGSNGTNIAPFNAALVKWNDGTINRHFKGRTYLSGLNADMLSATDKDQLDTTWRGSLVTRMAGILTGVSATTTYEFAVFSRELAEASVVTGGSVDETLAIQKRRRTSTQ